MATKPTTIKELSNRSILAEVREAYAGTSAAELSEQDMFKQYQEAHATLRNLMGLERSNKRFPRLSMKEATFAADFKLLFPKVTEDILQMPVEGPYIGQTLLSRTLNVPGAQIINFPALGTMRAFGPLAVSQEYPEQDLSFTANSTEIRTQRYGLKIAISEEVIAESQWDILALYIQAAGNAMRRLKEEMIFSEYEARAVTVFDNEDSDADYHTTGKGQDGQTANGTFSHMDLLDMMAILGSNNYVPTDLVLHNMAWSIWAKDPVLRYQLLQRGGIGQNLGNFGQDGDKNPQNSYVPFGLNIVQSPMQTLSIDKTLATGVTGEGAGNYTTITLVDRQSSILVLQRKPMSIAQWEDPMRDMLTMRFAEHYGLALLNGGRSAVQAKNVRLDINNEPLYTVNTVSL